MGVRETGSPDPTCTTRWNCQIGAATNEWISIVIRLPASNRTPSRTWKMELIGMPSRVKSLARQRPSSPDSRRMGPSTARVATPVC